MLNEYPGHDASAFVDGFELRDLMRRTISGVFLVVVAGGLLVAGPVPFGILVAIIASIISWEWSRLIRERDVVDAALGVHVVAVVIATLLSAFGLAALGAAVVLGGAILVALLTQGRRPVLSLAGVLVSGLPAVALLWLRGDVPGGLLAAAFVMLVAVACDTFSFATGKLLGGPRLAPKISPNKTWAGLIGGLAASGLTGLAFAYAAGLSPDYLAIIGLALGVACQAGDLAESAVKRAFRVKDASGLIPGHGGFMDRVDGLAVGAILAALLAILIGPGHPATALLTGV